MFSRPLTTHDIFGPELPSKVRIVEVGARDGLQNEAKMLPTHVKVELITRLADAGLKNIEAGSFVSPKWVPQMADTADVLKALVRHQVPGVTYSALVPNMKGYETALESGAREILVFTAAGEAFTRKNINCSIEESIERFKPIIARAHADNVRVRGCVSTVFADPYDGPVDPNKVATIARKLHDLGCYEVMLGDTTGVGNPGSTTALLNAVTKLIPAQNLAVHFHDTYGQALPNILVALRFGIASIDSGVAGFGGCPYAKGASGNIATEDVVYMLHGMGIETGVDLDKVIETGRWLGGHLGKAPVSRVSRARFGDTPAVEIAAASEPRKERAL
jgi:isopropylmalate/homocitrate/citramalate synthase